MQGGHIGYTDQIYGQMVSDVTSLPGIDCKNYVNNSCTLKDSLLICLGRDPGLGFTKPPYNKGNIKFEEFLEHLSPFNKSQFHKASIFKRNLQETFRKQRIFLKFIGSLLKSKGSSQRKENDLPLPKEVLSK